MTTILRKEGWQLNPDDKIVNSILRMIRNNDGKCPCFNTSEDTTCPCTDYTKKDICHCGLYKKIENN